MNTYCTYYGTLKGSNLVIEGKPVPLTGAKLKKDWEGKVICVSGDAEWKNEADRDDNYTKPKSINVTQVYAVDEEA